MTFNIENFMKNVEKIFEDKEIKSYYGKYETLSNLCFSNIENKERATVILAGLSASIIFAGAAIKMQFLKEEKKLKILQECETLFAEEISMLLLSLQAEEEKNAKKV